MPTTQKHTPAPWSRNIPPAIKYPVVFAGRNLHVAQVRTGGMTAEEVEANILLIVASPELLTTLREERDALDVWLTSPSLPEDVREGIGISLDKIRSAIRKAEGE